MRHFKLIHSLIGILLGLSLGVQAEGLVVVANIKEPVKLSREQVRNLYMGASLGQDLTPLALRPGNHLRTVFNTRVIGLSEARVQSYWAQMRFTGRLKPPPEVQDAEELVQQLLQKPGAVGYLPVGLELPEPLVVVYDLGL
ncbi:hypothetical protein GCM10011297_06250 [Bacterioplanes sanyensis]|uniref:hypothetical protein n=1 Tax=Bacterioplanes sanyensis TaxID=1249553 RepID=UPI00167BE2F3|nr:hypothetical protein [Bacterioplanes sanyensis]GGY35970.1 hypothetical protein GCM10011297_06250 [Bacterioplanes sanyensis]